MTLAEALRGAPAALLHHHILRRAGHRSAPALSLLLAACNLPTDAATRAAEDLQIGAAQLGQAEGATHVVAHHEPSQAGQCIGPYHVELVGAVLGFWCRDDAGNTVSSHVTSFHNRFVETSADFRLDKPANSIVRFTLERRAGRAVVIRID